ncbi:rhomboid family intramembrane serine protease [Parachlamydia sp. AcF125]|uniref:rhomboid family intramembrane serine protease n=1 Tax=Parachlamydia sp. AcF125 TaxID=2795736 RepID=UPI001BC9CE80|nr:rhomboid family intramembrane serine protease [Parachlamydia sp. AcF125]MBS4167964.1 Rhomboid protease GlpG [Parachlamydia sp. AcF125]
MRLVHTFHDPNLAHSFGSFLHKQGVEYQIEQNVNKDWGSPDYGLMSSEIWIFNEEDLEKVQGWLDAFSRNPGELRFKKKEDEQELLPMDPLLPEEEAPPFFHRQRQVSSGVSQPMGRVTLYFWLACILIFFISQFTTPQFETSATHLPYPVSLSLVKKALLYDYPQAFEVLDRFAEAFEVEKLPTSPEAKALLQEFSHTPYWEGIYDQIVKHFQYSGAIWEFKAPMFEKIRQGEVWRLFTPALLHSDLFHLFFNMLWLIAIGQQIEQRIGKGKYILFILLTGIFSNTAQYLMSGSNFLGFSGILCAMIAFIWVRQRYAAWEGYQVQRLTLGLSLFFIFTMLGIQLLSFALEVMQLTILSPGIANTAHLSGALLGYLLGKLPYFSWKGS